MAKEQVGEISQLLAIPFLPVTHIAPTFAALKIRVNNEPLQKLVDYIERQWIVSNQFPLAFCKTYGNVLILDGIIQCTDRDEFSYQEMLAHLPLNSHPNPTKVLIIGGGDGGVLREVLKHPCVEQVDQCEIDGKVIEVCKKYLPNMAKSFDDPKLNLHIGDGFEYMKNHQGEYDVIITDSSDPIGPASSLFERSYYELMKNALKPDGLLSCQGECIWLHLDLIKGMLDFCRSLFPVSDYAYTSIPTYPSGQIGFVLCSKNPDTNFREPARRWTQSQIDDLSLRYYNCDIHRGAFILPEFARKVLEFEASNDATGDHIANGKK